MSKMLLSDRIDPLEPLLPKTSKQWLEALEYLHPKHENMALCGLCFVIEGIKRYANQLQGTKEQPIFEWFIFRHTKAVWFPHLYKDMKRPCSSRIMRLFYPWHSHYDPTEFYFCMDCNKIGIRDSKDSTEEEYEQAKKECYWK